MHKFFLTTFLFLTTGMQAWSATLAVMVKDTDGKPLADTVVYLQSANAAKLVQAEEIQVEQKNKEFHPFVSVTAVGTSALFPNHDGIGHHVYSFSPTKIFELPLSEAESSMSVQFDNEGIITVGCNIHDWMVGYIYIVNTPYYAVTDKEGKTSIDNVPPATYNLTGFPLSRE